ncbi:MAG: MarR family transcriptional regulator [Treponema sp.]|nr:MarR family transcriptional regulator [Treponema sp.]
MNNLPDSEFIILENIYGSEGHPLRQRDLARATGMSLGMTNAILKRLVKKGFITVQRLNSRSIRYAVTLEGINEILRRSYRYFKRTIKNIVFYKDTLDEYIQQAKRRRINAVLLVGISDLDFIIEHACHRSGVSFLKAVDAETAAALDDHTVTVYAEHIPESPVTAKNTLYLSSILLSNAEGIFFRGTKE